MDPKECLRLADQAISDGDIDGATEHLDNYDRWRLRGGFEPVEVAGTTMRGDAFAHYCEIRLESLTIQNRARVADEIDGYNSDDIGESPDY